MRTHGWGGRPPADDDEAIDRIVAAARDCIDRKGASTSITDVAESLRVTRQTVYRYFAGTEALLQATALRGVGDFMDRLASRVGTGRDPGAVVVELVASALEQLPTEPYMGLLLTADRAGTFARGITSPTAMAFGRAIFERVDVDWAAVGLTGRLFDEFLEQVLRTIQSLVLDPGPARSGAALRSYLERWLWVPALHAARSAPGGDPPPDRPEGGGRTRSRAR
ncbi:MAG TPA: TetR/AcrR family transcriptional regulator [Acidimicrobiales bacterium]|nr:TetR/AcrR family transcriptional regulator [Acidimicrobiales bacterium]